MATKGPAGTAGFTLIEVAFAATIFLVAILGLSATLMQGDRMSQHSRQETAARRAMRGQYAEVSSRPFAELPGLDGTGFAVPDVEPPAGDEDGLPGEVEVRPLQNSEGTLAEGEGTSELYRVTLRVRWRVGSSVQAVETVHYLANLYEGELE